MVRFVIFLLAALSLSLVQAARPNFVWIIADDMSPDTGAYGITGLRTPNLDRLAAGGRRYTRAYASAPVCSSSRSAFILGSYQTTTGLQAHDVENPQPLQRPYKPLPALLREAGWFVTNASAPGSGTKKPKTHYNFAHDPALLFDGDDWRQHRPGQPFFAQFQISEPHRPFPIPRHFDEEALQELKLPPNYPDHPLARRDWYAYLRSVETVDLRVGAILDQLEKAGVLQDTVVMFFADHGRPMPWGKQWLSVEGLQVPLLMCGPGVPKGEVESRLVSLIDLAPSMLALAGLPVPEWMQGQAILGESFPERAAVYAARDRCGDAMDRVRAVITPDHLLVKNFMPGLSCMNWSSYKESSYPGMPLLRELQRVGALSPMQGRYLRAMREDYELYDLDADPTGLVNVINDSTQQELATHLKTNLDRWIQSSWDRGALPDPATEPSLADIQRDKKQDYLRVWQKRGFKSEPSDAQRLAWWIKRYGLPEAAPLH